jgi:iron complex transport system ATP-binding protein
MNLLRVENLTVTRRKRVVLDDVSFSVREGEFIGLIGPNGAGKSTLLRALMAQLPYSGTVWLNGRDSAAYKATERAQMLAYIAQEHEIGWNISVEMLVQLGRLSRLPRFAHLMPSDHMIIEAAMQALQIEHLRTQPARQLSGGEQTRVLIARALAQDTGLMLGDEPAAGLDPAHQLGLMKIFQNLATEGKAVICTLHDLGLAARWCSRLILLKQGRLIADGAPADILTPDIIRDLYSVEIYRAETTDGLIIQPTQIIV